MALSRILSVEAASAAGKWRGGLVPSPVFLYRARLRDGPVKPVGEELEPRRVFRRDGRFEIHALSRARVVEAQPPRVEHESAGFCLLPGGFGVNGIPDERMAQMEHVHAYLVGSARVQRAQNQGDRKSTRLNSSHPSSSRMPSSA